MMRLETHLESLQASSELLSSLRFSHPKSFQNTLLRQVPITQVIRDAEPHESSLFTTTATKKMTTTGRIESGAADVLRDREASLGSLLAAVETVVARYPVDGDTVLRRVEVMRVKADTLVRSIADLERDVEAQRRKLDDLSVGRTLLDPHEDAPRSSTTTTTTTTTNNTTTEVTVTDDMIRAEEEEIARLERVIEQKSRR